MGGKLACKHKLKAPRQPPKNWFHVTPFPSLASKSCWRIPEIIMPKTIAKPLTTAPSYFVIKPIKIAPAELEQIGIHVFQVHP